MENILDYNLEEISVWMKENGESAFRAKQVFSWIYKNIWDFSDMKNLPKSLIEKLKENFYIGVPEVVEEYESTLDGTKKILFAFKDGNIIESVIMKYKYGNSICISTQVGCRMGCKFCASTLEGRVRNLTAGEILSEVIMAQKVLGERISNIVLMGSGEPLDNYENVTKFLDLVNAEYGLNIGQRHITLSTCGLVPKIYDLADKGYSITLAISLHAFSDEKRREIMPIANKYSIKEILEACDYYFEKTGRRITFEYSLVSGINDGKEDAKSLSKLLKGRQCHINLIPVNEIKENTLKRPSKKTIEEFEKIVSENGLDVTVRREMGNDINAACGQLRRNFLKIQK
jgi:23S rRNA (adenine2503-C2)-methyltransferase